MYTEKDYQTIKNQSKKRLIVLLAPSLLLFVAVIISLLYRVQWLTMLLTILVGTYCIFFCGLFLAPVKAYEKHISNALYAKKRTTNGVFKAWDGVKVYREGVEYCPFMISVGEVSNPEDDRLFYFDANLPKPTWEKGTALTVQSHDKFVASWALQNDQA